MKNIKERNLADKKDFQRAMDYFGGEEHLRQQFPRILQMLYDTKALHEQSSKLLLDSANENGYEDTYEIIELPEKSVQANDGGSTEPSTAVYTKSYMSLVEKSNFLHLSTEISDPKYGKVFYANSIHDTNASYLEHSHRVGAELLTYSQSPRVQVKSEFVAIKSVNGKAICANGTQDREIYIDISNMQADVEAIYVSAPVPKNAADDIIKIVYKDRKDKNAAYTFTKATKKDGGLVSAYFPFTIEIDLNPIYEFDEHPIDSDENFYISLYSDVVKSDNNGGGGQVHFNQAYINKIKISADKNVLTVDFPYESYTTNTYWGTDMMLTGSQASGYFDFHFNAMIKYHLLSNPSINLSSTIVVSSEDLPDIDNSPNMKRVKKSNIVWGCLAKNAMIMMADGTAKPCNALCDGDSIMTKDGTARIKQVISGTSDKIIAVGKSDDDCIWLTAEHPVMTKRGPVCAGDISVGDSLATFSGEWKEIGYLAAIDYNDSVYSLELEKSSFVVANGYIVGDYRSTSGLMSANETAEKKLEELDPELMRELRNWSEWKSKELQKKVRY